MVKDRVGSMTDSKALTVSDEGKALAVLALDFSSWPVTAVPDEALALADDLEGARQAIERQMLALKVVEPNGVAFDEETERFRFTGKRAKIISDGLRPIGIKISGRMSAGEANAWLAAMILALSDLPFGYLRRAIDEVIHVPMKFLNEVETEIRIKAKASASRHNLALMNLKRLERELANPTVKALPRPEPLKGDELKSMSEPLRKIGLGAGWLVEGEDGKLSWAEGLN